MCDVTWRMDGLVLRAFDEMEIVMRHLWLPDYLFQFAWDSFWCLRLPKYVLANAWWLGWTDWWAWKALMRWKLCRVTQNCIFIHYSSLWIHLDISDWLNIIFLQTCDMMYGQTGHEGLWWDGDCYAALRIIICLSSLGIHFGVSDCQNMMYLQMRDTNGPTDLEGLWWDGDYYKALRIA